MDACRECDGSGVYVPKFSPDVLLECQVCNADGSRTVYAGSDPPAREMADAGALATYEARGRRPRDDRDAGRGDG